MSDLGSQPPGCLDTRGAVVRYVRAWELREGLLFAVTQAFLTLKLLLNDPWEIVDKM